MILFLLILNFLPLSDVPKIDLNVDVKEHVQEVIERLEGKSVCYAECKIHHCDRWEEVQTALGQASFTCKLFLHIDSIDEVDSSLQFALDHSDVTGLDIRCFEGIESVMHKIKASGFPIVLELGAKEGEENQRALLSCLQPLRIRDATFLQEDALDWICCHRTPIEIIVLRDEHPGLSLYKRGYPAVFSSKDFDFFAEMFNLTDRQRLAYFLQTLEFACLSDEERLEIINSAVRTTAEKEKAY